MTNWASPSGPSPSESEQSAPGAPQTPGSPPGPAPIAAQPQYGQYAPGYGVPGAPQPQFGGPPPPGYGTPPAYAAPMQFSPKPGIIPLRPLKLGDIIEGAFRTIRGNPGATLGLSFAVSLVFAIPTVLVTLLLSNVPIAADPSGDVSFLFANYGGQFFSFIASILLAGMLIAVVAEAVLGHRATIAEVWTKVRPRLWSLIGATLLILLAGLLTAGLAIGLTALAYLAAGTTAAIVVGVLAAIAVIFALLVITTKTSLATAAITLEKLGPVAGIKRSWQLTGPITQSTFWRIFGISLLAQLLSGTIASIVAVPAMLIGVVVFMATGDVDGSTPVGLLLWMQLVTVLVTALTAPFNGSVAGLLYIDQRIRREALDLNLMRAAGLK